MIAIETEYLKDILSLKLNKSFDKISKDDLKKIDSLELNQLDIVENPVSFCFKDLYAFDNLREIILNNMCIDDEAIAVLRSGTKLKSITFNNCKIGNLNFLLDLPSLEKLSFNQTPIKDYDVIKNLELKNLSLVGYKLKDLSFIPAENIKKLSLINLQIADRCLPTNLSGLEELNVSDTVIDNLSIIKKINSLRLLVVNQELIQKDKIMLFFLQRNKKLKIVDEHLIPLLAQGEM